MAGDTSAFLCGDLHHFSGWPKYGVFDPPTHSAEFWFPPGMTPENQEINQNYTKCWSCPHRKVTCWMSDDRPSPLPIVDDGGDKEFQLGASYASQFTEGKLMSVLSPLLYSLCWLWWRTPPSERCLRGGLAILKWFICSFFCETTKVDFNDETWTVGISEARGVAHTKSRSDN